MWQVYVHYICHTSAIVHSCSKTENMKGRKFSTNRTFIDFTRFLIVVHVHTYILPTSYIANVKKENFFSFTGLRRVFEFIVQFFSKISCNLAENSGKLCKILAVRHSSTKLCKNLRKIRWNSRRKQQNKECHENLYDKKVKSMKWNSIKNLLEILIESE